MSIEQKKIYVADDDDNIREAIQTFLEHDGFLVTAFENGDLLLEKYKKETCDLIILDIMMPGSNGFIVCSEIRKISNVPIIMLTARDSDLDYSTGLSLGSDDYFTKPFSAMALVMRVKAIFRRQEYEKMDHATVQDEGLLSIGDISINTKTKIVELNGEVLALTPNEYGLLSYLVEHSEQAVSRDELLDKVWGFTTEVETRAADDTVRRLRKKLKGSLINIEAVWGFGFRLKVCDAHE